MRRSRAPIDRWQTDSPHEWLANASTHTYWNPKSLWRGHSRHAIILYVRSMDMFRGRGALRHDFRIQMPFKNQKMDGADPILSVGITGHRSIAAEPIVSEAVEAAISVVLQALGKRGISSAATKHLATSTRFRLEVVSMLAEGADLLGMQAGLDCGAELVGVLPFDEQAYREAFESAPSQALFDHVWSKLSSIVVLGGFVGDDASYEQANRAILDRSDVLIAVWDGDPARGPGGTGDVVHDALERGLPVIVIRPHAETSPKLLGIAGETSFCADSLNFPHIDGTRQQLKGAQVRARADPRE